MLRVAVVGSGPAGVYATQVLTEHGGVLVDVIDRLPAPYGLVRYGVAPDHPKIRSISASLRKLLEHRAVRFLGNVEVGAALTLDDLHRHYDAVIFATGAAVDRRLDIPGEDLEGSYSATEFVAWYSGHPDAPADGFRLNQRIVAVIGAGNVALDVARMLAKTADELRPTDLPCKVLRELERSQVEDIHLLARRGPAQAKFTTKELRELGELANADIFVDPAELELDEASSDKLAHDPVARRNLKVLREWSQRAPAGRPRRVHLHFNLRPVEVLGETGVMGLRLERTQLDPTGRAVGTGRFQTIDAQMVLRSIGYRGLPVAGLPFDPSAGVVPNAAGRVLRGGVPVPGEYVAGWIKRGPTGVIGTNKRDARETVSALLADSASLPQAPVRDPHALARLLADRGVHVVSWQGWRAIERAELDLGRTQGRERMKIADREALLRAAAGGAGS
jgi:ferredoxin/flavodoxin---NADP+ reductase